MAIVEEHPRRFMTLRTVLHVGFCLCVFSFSMYLIAKNSMERQWRTARGDFVAEWPLPDGKHKLRLVKMEKGLKTYDWVPSLNSPWLERLFPKPEFPKAIHLKSQHRRPEDWESIGFVFRVVDERGQWDNIRYTIDQVGLKDSFGYVDYDYSQTTHEPGALLLEASWLPRRDKQLTIPMTFVDYQTPDQAYDFQLPNPFYEEDFPVWKAERKAPKTERGRTVSLIENESNWSEPYYLMEVINHSYAVSCESLITVEDPTGNRGHCASPFEPAWKVAANAFLPLERIAPAMIRDTQKLQVPPLSNTVLLNKTVEVQGAKLKLIAICGGGSASNLGAISTEYRLRSTYVDNEPFLVVQAEHIPRGAGIAIRSSYSEGRRQYWGRTLDSRDNGIPLTIPISDPHDRPKEIQLEIAESLSEHFEFMVEPPARLREKWKVPIKP